MSAADSIKTLPGTQQFAGTPAEIGAQVFEHIGPLAARGFAAADPKALAQFYAGLISAALGDMALHFGKEMADALAQRMVDTFKSQALGPQETH